MADESDFESLRPYRNREVAPILAQLVEDPKMLGLLQSVLPGFDSRKLGERIQGIETVADFQARIMAPAVAYVIETTTDGFSIEGLDALDPTRAHLFIGNHRDIVLDSALLGWATFKAVGKTMQVAIGDNLITDSWLAHLFKLNKTVIVARSLPKRALFEASKLLSAYIHNLIGKGIDSFWIAQAEGRTKTGNDFTQSGLVKMLSLAGGKNWSEPFRKLDPVPVSISYEYDPCDIAKGRELHQREHFGHYEKAPGEDLASMARGILGYKGRIHLQVGPSLARHWSRIEAGTTRGERLTLLTSELDRHIIGSYRLWPTNYLAYDLMTGKQEFRDHYSVEQVAAFEQRLAEGLRDDPHRREIRAKILEMYANPVQNHINLSGA